MSHPPSHNNQDTVFIYHKTAPKQNRVKAATLQTLQQCLNSKNIAILLLLITIAYLLFPQLEAHRMHVTKNDVTQDASSTSAPAMHTKTPTELTAMENQPQPSKEIKTTQDESQYESSELKQQASAPHASVKHTAQNVEQPQSPPEISTSALNAITQQALKTTQKKEEHVALPQETVYWKVIMLVPPNHVVLLAPDKKVVNVNLGEAVPSLGEVKKITYNHVTIGSHRLKMGSNRITITQKETNPHEG